ARRRPATMRRMIRDSVVGHLTARPGQPGMTPEEAQAYADKHFNPPYDPWDQRLCVVPDGDLFRAIREGRASVVTDHIDTFTETGVKLRSGEVVPADLIVTATGLDLLAIGGIRLTVDGREI